MTRLLGDFGGAGRGWIHGDNIMHHLLTTTTRDRLNGRAAA